MSEPDLEAALAAASRFRAIAQAALAERLEAQPMDRVQRAAHGFAWIATAVAALEALAGWLRRNGGGSPIDRAVARLAFAETIGQLVGGLPMSQNEIFRPADLGLQRAARDLADGCADLIDADLSDVRAPVAAALRAGQWPSESLGDAAVDAVRDQFRRFAEAEILPHAHQWHLDDALIPGTVIDAMAALGTFGICIPQDHGGLGLSRLVMCVVTEELSRAWVGAGSLGTRSEIAGELIATGGTEEQKAWWLPRIASGEVLPAAVFTEPDVGSDLGAIGTRARRVEGGWRIEGAKSWITHAARADLMTLLARTVPGSTGHDGLSMLLVPKRRGTDDDPFPDAGLSGSEIEVLGYRGMREYALQFDGMAAPADALLGGEEGKGFRQLMRTFEGARIQTAARAVGVARRAIEIGLAYACDRRQFGRPIVQFPRVADKLVMSLVDFVLARELTHEAARARDEGRRCDIEAGMAKLFAARAAWANADAALQVHGGNGYALDYEASRLLCDARIFSIFEGAAEIQAQVIAKGLVGRRN